MPPPLHITPYRSPHGPLHAWFHDENNQGCTLTETITCDLNPRILLGVHGRLMLLSPARARQLLHPLHHFAHHGRLPHPTATPTGDYEI